MPKLIVPPFFPVRLQLSFKSVWLCPHFITTDTVILRPISATVQHGSDQHSVLEESPQQQRQPSLPSRQLSRQVKESLPDSRFFCIDLRAPVQNWLLPDRTPIFFHRHHTCNINSHFEKQVPVTRPTYPVPTINNFII